jgi:DNA-binding MarR family transcriptional regulator
MGAAAIKTTNQEELRANEKKWGLPLLKAGWCLLPATILERQQALGLTPTDVNILMHLIRHWWVADRLPFPSKRTIAECMGCHPSTVQRRIARMEAAGFINRIPRSDREHGQRSNAYDLSGLVEAATPYAQEILEERAAKDEEIAKRRKRKQPKLKVVSADTKK